LLEVSLIFVMVNPGGGVRTQQMDTDISITDHCKSMPAMANTNQSKSVEPMNDEAPRTLLSTEKSKASNIQLSVTEFTEQSKRKLLRQVEYYFSDANLPSDKFLKDTMMENNGWVPLRTLFKFPRVKQLVENAQRLIPGVNPVEHLREALRGSAELLRISEDGFGVQRATPIVDPQVVADRTVAVLGFPTKREFNREEQMMFWGQFGGVLSVKRYVPFKGQAAKCMVFVEFDSKEIAEEVLLSEVLDYDGIEVTLKKRVLQRRKRKRGEEVAYRPDSLIKLTEFPKDIK